MSAFKRSLKTILPEGAVDRLRRLNHRLLMVYGDRSYAQCGEDMILRACFPNQRRGFYVDVGAYHPVKFSNTYHFYRRGWRGIVIEPTPGGADLFRRKRPRDIALEMGIGARDGARDFYMYENADWNTFDADKKAYWESRGVTPVRCETVPVRRLDGVLGKYLPAGVDLDFISIDAEGLDEDIVRSNDWTRYRPKVVCVEILWRSLDDVADHPMTSYLSGQGYELAYKVLYSVFYKDRDFHLT